LLAVGEVRLWGMGAEQVIISIYLFFDQSDCKNRMIFFAKVASILRQAGQDSIRLVIARPVDPSSPSYGVSFISMTKNHFVNC